MDVAQAGARARLAPAARADSKRAEAAPAQQTAPKSLRDLPPGTVAKLTAVKAEASAAGARAADAAHHHDGHGGGSGSAPAGGRRRRGAPA
eukprot:5341471-Pleurochrysis_carterae.AAC.1